MNSRKTLGFSFFDRKSTVVARDLIGKSLVRGLENGVRLEGTIVEVEAYGGLKDPASHAFRGLSRRNEVMFRGAGRAYIYFTYGNYYCLNFVTNPGGSGAGAVLMRAVEPTKGLDFMMEKRKTTVRTELASGPGKLCQAFAIDGKLNGIGILNEKDPIHIEVGSGKRLRIGASARIGISLAVERRWRFYAAGSPYVSHHRLLVRSCRRKLNLPRS